MGIQERNNSKKYSLKNIFLIFSTFRTLLLASIFGLTATSASAQILQWGVNFRAYENFTLCLDSSVHPIVGGVFTGNVDFDPGPGTFLLANPGIQDGFISNFSRYGNFLWAGQVGGTSYQQILDLMTDVNGNLYACGNALFNEGLVEKRDPNHFLKWRKTFYTPSSSNSFRIQCKSMTQSPSGHLYITGYHKNTTTFSTTPLIQLTSPSETMFILKMDTLGNVIWVKQTETPTDLDDCMGMTIITDANSNLFVYGKFNGTVDFDPDTNSSHILTSPGFGETFLMKLDSVGNFNWVCNFPNTTIQSNSSMYLSDDVIYLTGGCYGNTDFDPGPGVLTIPGMSNGTFILQMDTMKNFHWVKGIAGNNCSGMSVTTDLLDNIYVCGYFGAGPNGINVDFDPGPAVVIDTSMGYWDGYVLKLNQAGQYLWHGKLGGSDQNKCISIVADSIGSIFVAGTFSTDQDLDPFSNVLTVTDTVSNAFLIKIGQCGYTSQTVSISNCDTAWYNGIPFTHSGPHFLTYTDIAGCDSTIIIDADVFPSYRAQYSLSGCDSVLAGNQFYTQSGNYTSNFQTINGCDSVIVYFVTVHHSNDSTLFYSGCDSVIVDNQVYYASQQITSVLTTSNGCDSLLTKEILISPSYLVPVTVSACDSVILNGITYTASGNYSHSLVSVAGCDSIVQYNLTISYSSNSTLTASSCDSLIYNGIVYTSSGTYAQILPNSSGCDSTITFYLTIPQSSYSTLNLNGCDSVNFGNQVFYSSGNYQVIYSNSAGCDSIVSLNVSVTKQDTSVLVNGITLVSLQTSGTFQWVNCSNGFTPVAGATSPIFTPSINGSYAVILNESGCVDTSACVNVTSVWINETHNEITLIYPSPAAQVVYFNLPFNASEQIIEIYDEFGRFISSMKTTGSVTSYDVTKFAPGAYNYRILLNSVVVKNGRFEVIK